MHSALRDRKCLRCRKFKKKCTGDPGDGSGCESCRSVSGRRECIFVRPDTWLLDPDNASSMTSVYSATSIGSRWNNQTGRQPLPPGHWYREEPALQNLQPYHNPPALGADQLQSAAMLPTPAQSPSISPVMSLLNSAWPSQPSFQRKLPPGFTDPVFYTSQARMHTRNDGDIPEARWGNLSRSRFRSCLASVATSGRTRGVPLIVECGGRNQ